MIEIKIIIKAINNIKNSAKFIHWPLIIIFLSGTVWGLFSRVLIFSLFIHHLQ